MKETLLHLQSLQDLSGQIEQTRRDAETLQADVRNQERLLAEKKRRASQVHDQRVEAAKKADETELEIDGAETEIERLRVQLNVTRHQKEYDALQHGILSHQADISRWEDQELSALQTTDELSEEEKRLAKEVQQAERELEQTKQRVAQEHAELEGHIAKLQEQYDALRQQINPAVLSA
ncbi:MAG: zinc ribbon domain-containing protein, partial [Planctomycetota bacterium]